LEELFTEKYGRIPDNVENRSDEDREVAERLLEIINGFYHRTTSMEVINGQDFYENQTFEEEKECYHENAETSELQIGTQTFTLDYMKKAVRIYTTLGWKSAEKLHSSLAVLSYS